MSLNNSGANDVAITDSNAIVLGASNVGSGNITPLYLEHPHFEGFEVRQTIEKAKSAA